MKTPERTPQYDHTKGIDIDIYPIGESETPRRVTLSDIPVVNINHESWSRVRDAIDASGTEGGIGFTSIPPAQGVEDSGTVEVYHFPWGGYTDNAVGRNEMTAYAASHPASTILVIDSPATGNSDRLLPSVSKEIARTGSYLPYGEVFVDAFAPRLRDYEKRIFAGSSQGGRRAIGAVAHLGSGLELLTAEINILEPVGSHDQSTAELMKGFTIREAGHTAKYTEASHDELGAAAQREIDDPLYVVGALKRIASREGLINQLVREPRAMAKGGLAEDLKAALPYVKTVIVNTSELSELTRVEDVRRILEVLANKNPEKTIEHRVLMRQTHALLAGNPGLIGKLLSRYPDTSE